MDLEPKRNEAAFPVIWTVADVSIWIDLLNIICNRLVDRIEQIRIPVPRNEHGAWQSGCYREWNMSDDTVARCLLDHCLRFRRWLDTQSVSQGRVCLTDYEQVFMRQIAAVVLRCTPEQERELAEFMAVSEPKRLIVRNLADLRRQYQSWQDRLAEPLECVQLDFRHVTNAHALQQTLKEGLFFPDFYGMNWSAFMDVMTDLVPIPRRIEVLGWSHLCRVLPEDARLFELCMNNIHEEFVLVKHDDDPMEHGLVV